MATDQPTTSNPPNPNPQPNPLRLERFDRAGPLAIDPSALGLEFLICDLTAPPFEIVAPGVAAVTIAGPLTYGAGPFNTYRRILDGARAALADESVHAVVLRLNTPGGDVWGSFEAARALRAAADTAGKRLIAYVESQACSAGYALAAVAHEVIATDTAVVGSIGVIAAVREESAALERAGIRFSVITSGARKADGHPAIPATDEALAALQKGVDAMAAVFFRHVATFRGGFDPAALEAATFVGAEALALGLVDRLQSFDATIQELSDPNAALGSSGAKSVSMAGKSKSAVRAALVAAIADDSDKEECARAKKALAIYDGDDAEPEKKADDAEPEKKDEPAEAAKAAPAAAADPEPEKKDEPPAAAAAAPAGLSAAAVAEIVTKALADRDAKAAQATDRSALYEAYAVSADLRATLDGLPLDAARKIVEALPKPAGFKNPFTGAGASARAAAGPTAGAGQAEGTGNLPDEDREALDRAFGKADLKPSVTHKGTVSTFSFAGKAS
jgi:ClpP class serine protease